MTGKRLAQYEILGSLGAGGMGEVHRARDTRLDREVALKVLPADLAQDAERLARLQREAKTLASLQHPNLATVYDFGQEDDVSYLVMELVEGEDLEERLQRGALSVEDACEFALQAARGLEAAHLRNIVHRDLKPANIRLASDGTVKILDFGLARSYEAPAGEQTLAHSPTITAAFTQVGTILGTAAYMSPEQARGQVVDTRADVWAFGTVLFEMLTGRQVFAGDTVSDTLAGVLRAELDWNELPSGTPPALRRLLERCLERDPNRRLQSIGEARIGLEDIQAGKIEATMESPRARRSRPWPWLVAVAALVGMAALWFERPEVDVVPRTHADLIAGPGVGYDVSDLNLALSPDGTQLAFAGLDDSGHRWIYVRNLGTGELRRLEGTEDGEIPFWSPDGSRIGFWVTSSLCTIGVGDGIIERNLASSTSWTYSGAWHPEGWIMLVSNHTVPKLLELSATGGEPTPFFELVGLERSDLIMAHPSFLPDGTILVSVDPMDGSDVTGTYVIEDGQARMVIPGASNAHWVDSGHVIFRREQRIFAQRFDPDAHELLGEPLRIGGPVRSMTFPGQAFMAVAGDGTLVYLEGEAGASNSELVWADRQGKVVERLGLEGDLYPVRISPDGRRVALDNSKRETAGDIWIHDFARGSSVQYTNHPLDESSPVWSRDGNSIFFAQSNTLCRLDVSGAPTITRLTEDEDYRRPLDVHPTTGQLMIQIDRSDLGLMDTETRSIQVWLDLPGIQGYARFSPDGDWVVYESQDDEGSHVWLERFPDRRERFRVTGETGGNQPVWRRDGTEIYFTSPSRKLMAVSLDLKATERSPLGAPIELFPVRLRRNMYYDVGTQPDRFLLNQLTGDAAVPNAVMVRGWSVEE